MTRLFDAYVFVDWSASNGLGPATPKKDSVWVGMASRSSRPEARYCRSRGEATELVAECIADALAKGDRILVGFDFPYGYPSGLAAAAGCTPSNWLGVWNKMSDLLVDDCHNQSNRFQVAGRLNALISHTGGPFWGCPESGRSATLASTGPGFPVQTTGGVALGRLRECERRLTGTQEAWKLFGAGSVGSQALTGIPRVRSLRFNERFASQSQVWPFETGFTANCVARVVHAEIWPGVVKSKAARMSSLIADQAQVLAMCEWANELDDRSDFAQWFEEPDGLKPSLRSAVLEEEGWVLGCR